MRIIPTLSLAAAALSLVFADGQVLGADKKMTKPVAKVYPSFGSIERLDPALDALIPADAKLEKLAEGFEWSEGPVWDVRNQCLYFSDVPRNVVFKWQEGTGTRDHVFPSGYTGSVKRGGEPGSNGLAVDKGGHIILCQHGDRRVARLEKDGTFTTLAQYYKDRRFNSPNDLAIKSTGDIYFTDPPYGLEKNNADPKKELMFNGVYRIKQSGEVVLLDDTLSFPNGIALSPDEKTLYVAISDQKKPVIMAYDIQADGNVGKGRVFFDTTSLLPGRKGVPDGLKVDEKGNIFTTGPGGVLIISPEGKHLGTINTGEATANCGWGGPDGRTLYITADMYLCRVKTITRGPGFK